MLNRTLLMILAGVALAVSACGDDEDGGPTKAEFIEEADGICREGEQKAEELARAGLEDPRNPTGPEVLAILNELVPVQQDIIDRIRDLDQPEGDEDEIDEFLTMAEDATDEVAQIENPREALAIIQASDTEADPFYEADRAARDYGLEVCGD